MRFENEAALAKVVSGYLSAGGWTCYHEVTQGGGFPRADIVAKLGPRLWVIECKMSMSLALLAQAQAWQAYAHRVSVAVPSRRTKGQGFGAVIASRHLGLGVMYVRPECGGEVTERHAPVMLRRPPCVSTLAGLLHDDQRDTTPGEQSADYSTPFRRTCRQMLATIHEAGGSMPVREALLTTEHHYSSYSSARSSLLALAEAGKAHGILLHRDGKRVTFETRAFRDKRVKAVAGVT